MCFAVVDGERRSPSSHVTRGMASLSLMAEPVPESSASSSAAGDAVVPEGQGDYEPKPKGRVVKSSHP